MGWLRIPMSPTSPEIKKKCESVHSIPTNISYKLLTKNHLRSGEPFGMAIPLLEWLRILISPITLFGSFRL